jgi:predicted transcriptional regulator
MKVKEIMHEHIEWLYEDQGIVETCKFLRDKKLRRAFVVNREQLPVGVISASDVAGKVIAEEKDPKDYKVSDIMTSTIMTVSPETGVPEAAIDLDKQHVPSAAVIENGKLVGVLTRERCIDACLSIIEKVTEED